LRVAATYLVLAAGFCGAALGQEVLTEPPAMPVNSLALTDASINQDSADNDIRLAGIKQRADLTDVGNAHLGIFTLNQDAGTANSQANVVAAGIDSGESGVVAASVNVRQRLQNNTVQVEGGSGFAGITDSFNGGRGIAQVNQAAGALNQQVNLVALAMGGDDGAGGAQALSDVQLSHVGDSNGVTKGEQPFEGEVKLENSFNGFSGVAQVNQTVGQMNRVVNAVTITRLEIGG
jgi:hypothetical protein